MRIAVLGAGAWGTSIASVLAPRLEVVLWAQSPEQAQAIHATRRNERYLPGIELPKSLIENTIASGAGTMSLRTRTAMTNGTSGRSSIEANANSIEFSRPLAT